MFFLKLKKIFANSKKISLKLPPPTPNFGWWCRKSFFSDPLVDFFQNLQFSAFPDIIWLVCRVVTIFLLTERVIWVRSTFQKLSTCSWSPQKKFSRALWKKWFRSKNEEQMKINMRLGYYDKTSFLERKFFSMGSKNCSVDFTNMFELSEMSD